MMGTPQGAPRCGHLASLQGFRQLVLQDAHRVRARGSADGLPQRTFFLNGRSKVFTILKQQTYDKIVGDSINL